MLPAEYSEHKNSWRNKLIVKCSRYYVLPVDDKTYITSKVHSVLRSISKRKEYLHKVRKYAY
jgi:hypothetical protein